MFIFGPGVWLSVNASEWMMCVRQVPVDDPQGRLRRVVSEADKKKGVAAESFIRRHGPGWTGVQSACLPAHAGALALDDKETAPGPGRVWLGCPFSFLPR